MSTISDDILKAISADLRYRQQKVSIDELKDICRRNPPAKDSYSCFRQNGAVTVISEIRRKDPFNLNYQARADLVQLAEQFVSGGAAIISVATEPRYFGGSFALFSEIRAAVEVPMLFRNFILTSYQLIEARALGADLVMLIAPLLEPDVLTGLIERTCSLGMVPLVQVHSRYDALKAMRAGAKLLSVSGMSLRTMEGNDDSFSNILDIIPQNVLVIAETGAGRAADVFNYAQEGADGVLVSSSMLDDKNPEATMQAVKAAASHPALANMRRQKGF